MISGAGISGRRKWRDRLELLVGLAVLAALGVVVALAVVSHQRKSDDGYRIHAVFSRVDGLDVGSDVRLAGITVGHVLSEQVDPKSFQADVTFSVDPRVKLPVDSGAVITSDSLLGGKYIDLSPGGELKLIAPGGAVNDTQGSISLEQLLSKFIFSVTDSLQKNQKSSQDDGLDQP